MKCQAQEKAVLEMQGSCIIYPPLKFTFDADFVDFAGKNGKSGLKICWVGNSKYSFVGMKEHQVTLGLVSVNWHTLEQNASSKEIISQLGGLKRVVLTLSEVYALLADQVDEKNLFCRENGNILFVLNRQQVAVAMNIYWNAHYEGWMINTVDAELPHQWKAGSRVFSLLDA